MKKTVSTRFRALLLVAVCSLAGPSAGRAAEACDAPEFQQFDFWLGEWEVTTPDGDIAGTNRIEKILGGCVLQENWTGAQGMVGKSFNIYSAPDDRWHQTWVDSRGTLLELNGGLRDGKMVLSGTSTAAEGREVLHEVSWEALEDGRVRQHWRASEDGGQSWSDLFIGIYAPAGGTAKPLTDR